MSVEDPLIVAWEAVDVDNAGGSGAIVPPAGLIAGNGSASSPNIRILLTSADFERGRPGRVFQPRRRSIACVAGQFHGWFFGG